MSMFRNPINAVLFFMVSFVVVFAVTFFFMNGRSFHIPKQPTALESNESEEQRVDSDLDSLQLQVSLKKQLLDSLASEVRRRQSEIARLEERLNTLRQEAKQEELRRAGKLASILAALPDSAVSSMVSKLDDELLVMVLQKSTEKSAARVLAALDPRRAARLSERLVKAY